MRRFFSIGIIAISLLAEGCGVLVAPITSAITKPFVESAQKDSAEREKKRREERERKRGGE